MEKTTDRVAKLHAEKFLEAVRSMPLVSFDLLVRDAAGRLLLGRRKNEPARGFWFVPGGIIRKGETLEEAFARITLDELGQPLRLTEARRQGVYEHFYEENAAGVAGVATHYIVLAYELIWQSGLTGLPLDQHDEYGWFSEAEIRDHPRVHTNTKAYCRKRIITRDLEGESPMSEFNNVSIIKQANVYFDGKVTSRTVIFADGSKKTLGIMLPGAYVFNTADKEQMDIITGRLDVLLPGADSWQTVKGGESFIVPADSSFSLKVTELTDYCCSFLRD
jgi:uncharacterized protein YaiE (UPF0345 family)/ADP-ribose pyrophosphatase YjhB (NUDIX family)